MENQSQNEDVKNYNIQGQTIVQAQLTIGQVRKLTQVLGDVSFDGLSPMAIVNKLIDADVLDKVLSIILNGPDDFALQVDAMLFTDLVEIIQDFLSCNNVAGLFGTILSGMERLNIQA